MFSTSVDNEAVAPAPRRHSGDALGLKWEAVRNKESGDKRYAADRCQVTRHAARSETADGCRSDGDTSAPSFPAPAKSA